MEQDGATRGGAKIPRQRKKDTGDGVEIKRIRGLLRFGVWTVPSVYYVSPARYTPLDGIDLLRFKGNASGDMVFTSYR